MIEFYIILLNVQERLLVRLILILAKQIAVDFFFLILRQNGF